MIRQEWIQTAVFVLAVLAESTTGSTATKTDPAKSLSLSKIPTSANTTRIVGGTWAKRGAYPYQAALFVNGVFNCGGTLLPSRLHVLTAAHCYSKKLGTSSMTIVFRTTVLNPLDSNFIKRNVSEVTVHPDYNETSFVNDIGIITLSEIVTEIRPTILEPATSLNESYAGMEATIIGWGRTRQVLYPAVSSGVPSNNLRHVNVTIIDTNDCRILYYDTTEFKDNKRLCASTLFGRSLCQGDSGGPLLMNGIQIGINSAAAGCADPRYPAIFIRVGHYLDWIRTTMGSTVSFKPA